MWPREGKTTIQDNKSSISFKYNNSSTTNQVFRVFVFYSCLSYFLGGCACECIHAPPPTHPPLTLCVRVVCVFSMCVYILTHGPHSTTAACVCLYERERVYLRARVCVRVCVHLHSHGFSTRCFQHRKHSTTATSSLDPLPQRPRYGSIAPPIV